MGFFDRLGRLGRGMVKTWTDPERRRRERSRRLAALEAELERMAARAGGGAPAEDDRRGFLSKLEQARIDGVLTPEEYRRKRAEALGETAGAAAGDGGRPGGATPVDDAPGDSPVERTL